MGEESIVSQPRHNYEENNSWGNLGWLGSDEYYAFWSNVFLNELAPYFENKTIFDIGAGNGRIWNEALKKGLKVTTLNLVDQALDIAPELESAPNVTPYKKSLADIPDIHCDTILFKQSLHHIYSALGDNMFDHLHAQTFINLCMPAQPNWPISPELKKKYAPSYLDVAQVVKRANKNVTETFDISYPVEMSRDTWCAMLKERFTSILHDCEEDFINREIEWVKENLPEQLKFFDHLECMIFK